MSQNNHRAAGRGGTRRTQLLTLLHSMKQQGKESATFNIDFLIEACQDSKKQIRDGRKVSEAID